jgi:hypothetical protein
MKIAEMTKAMTYPKDRRQLFRHPAPRIAKFDRDVSIKYLTIVAAKMVGMLYEVNKVPNSEAFELWSEMILEDFPDLRTVEIKEIFKQSAKMQNYNRIDVQIMYDWVKSYYADREEIIAAAREQYHRELKAESDQSWSGAVQVPQAFIDRTNQLEREYLTSVAGARANKSDLKVHEVTTDQKEMIRQQAEILKNIENEVNEIVK